MMQVSRQPQLSHNIQLNNSYIICCLKKQAVWIWFASYLEMVHSLYISACSTSGGGPENY